MPDITHAPLSRLVQQQMSSPSPIRHIMKMAERQNILAMGLNPNEITSCGLTPITHRKKWADRQSIQGGGLSTGEG